MDEAIRYLYDSNGRLLGEDADLDGDEVIDRTTLYDYAVTQQTGKEVRSGGVLASRTTTSYDLQGRTETTTVETFQADGVTVDRREATTYDYDPTGIRVSARNRVTMWQTDPVTQESEFVEVRDYTTEYLVDHDNFTGYEQVLKETTTPTGGGYPVRQVIYTLGHDVIGQWSQGAIGEPGQEGSSMYLPQGSHLLLYDGHGSTRILAEAGHWDPYYGTPLVQQYAYDAYGVPLGFDPTESATTFLYSGEQFDQRSALYYLRAREYDCATGTFTTLDPFAGNTQDPQSLHKYVYCHGDPITGVDPSGLEFSLATMSVLTGSIGGMGMSIAACMSVALVAGYVSWSHLGPESFAQWGTPEAWLARETGVASIRSFATLYQFQRERLRAGSAYFADLSPGVDSWLDSVCDPIYQDADLRAIFDEYASLYPNVTSRRCDLALDRLVSGFKPWVFAHHNETNGVVFMSAVWKRIPWGAQAAVGYEDDNILILLPTKYYNEVKANNNVMTDPSWYNTAEKRNILYFYPGSLPVNPVDRLYSHFISRLNGNKPGPNDLPRLNVDPDGPDTFIKP